MKLKLDISLSTLERTLQSLTGVERSVLQMMQGRRSELRVTREDQIKDILSGHYIAISFKVEK